MHNVLYLANTFQQLCLAKFFYLQFYICLAKSILYTENSLCDVVALT